MSRSETENFSEKVVRFPLSALACGEKKNCHIDLRNWPHQQVLSALPFCVGMISRRKEPTFTPSDDVSWSFFVIMHGSYVHLSLI